MVRRSFLVRMLALAGGALGIAALFPINSLGPHPGDTLKHTSWSKGSRLVTEDGQPVRLGALAVDGVLTVFPDGHTDDAESQTILINIGDAPQVVRRGRQSWSVSGYVAYSKVCTHAGCPVGLYRSSYHQLLCPCHQSTFDVLQECRPVFGPAATPLPQLPLAVDDSGYLSPRATTRCPSAPASGTNDEASPRLAGHRLRGGRFAGSGRSGPAGGSMTASAYPASPRASSTRSSLTIGRSCSARSPCTASSSWC